MLKKFRGKAQSAKRKIRDQSVAYSGKVRRGYADWPLDEEDRLTLDALRGHGGRSKRMLCSDLPLLLAAAYAFARLLLAQMRAHPSRRYYLITLFDDQFNASDRIPVVQLALLGAKVKRAVTSINLNGVGKIEVHPLINYPAGGKGRTLLFHAHFIAWSDGPFDHAAAETKLLTSRAWKCSFGAPAASIKPITAAREDLERTALYLMKPPYCAKNLMPDHKRPGAVRLMDTIKGYRPEFALRVFEGLSQIDLGDTLVCTGDGRVVRRDLLRGAAAWHASHTKTGKILDADLDIWSLWRRLRCTNGSPNYASYRFDILQAKPVPKHIGKPKAAPFAPRPPRPPRPGASWAPSKNRPRYNRETWARMLREKDDL